MAVTAKWAEILPTVRHANRYEHRGDFFYEELDQTETRLFCVVGWTDDPEDLLDRDAFIENGKILESSFNERYHTVDGYHKDLDRQVSLNAERELDEPIVALDEVRKLGDD